MIRSTVWTFSWPLYRRCLGDSDAMAAMKQTREEKFMANNPRRFRTSPSPALWNGSKKKWPLNHSRAYRKQVLNRGLKHASYMYREKMDSKRGRRRGSGKSGEIATKMRLSVWRSSHWGRHVYGFSPSLKVGNHSMGLNVPRWEFRGDVVLALCPFSCSDSSATAENLREVHCVTGSRHVH